MNPSTLWEILISHGVIEKVGNSETSSTFQITIGTDWTHKTLTEAVTAKARQVLNGQVVFEAPDQTPVYREFSGNARERIIRIIAEHLGMNPSEVLPEHRIIADYGADSLDTVELIMALEDEFGVEIFDEVAESVVTVDDILKHPFWPTVGVFP